MFDTTDTLSTIRFKGENYLLTGNLEDGGAITTKEAYEAGAASFAHLMPDGTIKRFGEQIGTREDIEVTGECEVNIGLHSLLGLGGPSWVRPEETP